LSELLDTLKDIAHSLKVMAEPVELDEMPGTPEPVCPYCGAQNPQVIVTASELAKVALNELMLFSLDVICAECTQEFEVKPTGIEIVK